MVRSILRTLPVWPQHLHSSVSGILAAAHIHGPPQNSRERASFAFTARMHVVTVKLEEVYACSSQWVA